MVEFSLLQGLSVDRVNNRRIAQMEQTRIELISAHPSLPGVMRIQLRGGEVALIDEDDFPLVSKYRWRLRACGDGLRYVVTNHRWAGKCYTLYLHRLILMVGPSRVVDHVSGDGLDNRKTNLRACAHAENLWNSRLSRANKTGVKGLREVQTPHGVRWQAKVTANKVVHRRKFIERGKAEQWLATTRAELHGEFNRAA